VGRGYNQPVFDHTLLQNPLKIVMLKALKMLKTAINVRRREILSKLFTALISFPIKESFYAGAKPFSVYFPGYIQRSSLKKYSLFLSY